MLYKKTKIFTALKFDLYIYIYIYFGDNCDNKFLSSPWQNFFERNNLLMIFTKNRPFKFRNLEVGNSMHDLSSSRDFGLVLLQVGTMMVLIRTIGSMPFIFQFLNVMNFHSTISLCSEHMIPRISLFI